MSASIYLVCGSCGWFSGDLRLYEDAEVKCGDCGLVYLFAFGKLDDALKHQAFVRDEPIIYRCPDCGFTQPEMGRCGRCPTGAVRAERKLVGDGSGS